MSYYDKYHCIGCPVEKYCGTVVSTIKLCHSLNDSMSQKETTHVLTLSKAAQDEDEHIEEQLTMWDNITD